MSEKSISRTLFTLLGLVIIVGLQAQYDCKEYEKFNCAPSSDKHFKRNGQSRSAMIQIGVPAEMNLIVYRGQDYRITLCADQEVLGDVSFRLVELKRQLKKSTILGTDTVLLTDDDGEYSGSVRETRISSPVMENSYETVRKVLYDNTEDGMSQTIEFSSTATKRIIVEVVAPGSDNPKKKRNSISPDIACIGILVEHMPTPGIGF